MILNAVIIILREVLEAALIISVFLALSRMLKQDRRWVLLGLGLGLIGAIAYATSLDEVSLAFDGVGQEIINAVLHCLIYIGLIVYAISMWPARQNRDWQVVSTIVMVLSVTVASAREGAEVFLYISGFVAIPEMLHHVLLGSVVGTGIGVSVGVFIYYLLVNISLRQGFAISYFIIILLGGSMISQMMQFLIQADIITAASAIWDTSDWVDERSVSGQLLYAMIGYEATPAPIQAKAYILSIVLLILASVMSWFFTQRKLNHG